MYERYCLNFQAQAFGYRHSNWASARKAANWLAAHGHLHTRGVPPRGTLVWYGGGNGYGHVMLSLGDGRVVGTSVHGAVGEQDYKAHSHYRGWSMPYFPFAK